MPEPAPADPTRTKLLEAAGQVFAEHGFHAATVREICSRAGANVAAINYYFGDKVELYEEVLRQAISAVHDSAMREALNDMEPRKALRRVVHHMTTKLCSANRASWTMRLMAHEMAQPTPSFARVIDEIIAPNSAMLRRVIGRLLDLPPEHEKTRLCANSVMGQVIHYAYARPVLARLWPELKFTEETMDHIAEHIADFSLAYLTSRRASHRTNTRKAS